MITQQTDTTSATDFCYRHPDRETGLRCTSCGRGICPSCLVYAVVGQICRSCAQVRRPVNYQISAGALALAIPAAGLLSVLIHLAALMVSAPMPIFVMYILLAGSVPASRLMVRILDRLTRAKRGRLFQITVGVATVLGALPVLLTAMLFVTPVDALLVLIFAGALTIGVMTRLR